MAAKRFAKQPKEVVDHHTLTVAKQGLKLLLISHQMLRTLPLVRSFAITGMIISPSMIGPDLGQHPTVTTIKEAISLVEGLLHFLQAYPGHTIQAFSGNMGAVTFLTKGAIPSYPGCSLLNHTKVLGVPY